MTDHQDCCDKKKKCCKTAKHVKRCPTVIKKGGCDPKLVVTVHKPAKKIRVNKHKSHRSSSSSSHHNRHQNNVTVNPQAKVEVKAEEPKVEVKAEEPKVEVKAEEPKVEVKAETK